MVVRLKYMNKITDMVGAAFRIHFEDSLGKPLSWRMIDALSTLDEIEEEQRRQRSPDCRDGMADGSGEDLDQQDRKNG